MDCLFYASNLARPNLKALKRLSLRSRQRHMSEAQSAVRMGYVKGAKRRANGSLSLQGATDFTQSASSAQA